MSFILLPGCSCVGVILQLASCHPSLLQASLLKNVFVRFALTMGSIAAAALLLTAEDVVAEELDRRIFWVTLTSFVREVGEQGSELSGMASGATVDAEKVAW